ncbi:MAG: flagellar motor protein MotB [Bdellovibrionota bacterium]|nr:flagellar motor protein MotB [Bdellovibrionota bacterium]
MADEEVECPEPPVCEECVKGAPAWMATFSDLVTLLLTFFVLLYAMSKTDESKFESMAGSIRKAFAGNAMKIGETIQLGKSPDDSPTMIESQDPVEPFPIDLLTTEGLLDKKEINRESDEDLEIMKKTIKQFNLDESVDTYQMPEGIKMRVKDVIVFEVGTTNLANNSAVPAFKRVVNLMKEENWTLYVEGYADRGESGVDGTNPYELSSKRAQEVTASLVRQGVSPEQITTVFYGDSRAVDNDINRKVEFVLRKTDLRTEGKRVRSQ